MSYEALAHVIKIGGTVMFTLFFLVAIGYALWPKNKARFDAAARIPLNDTDVPEV